MASFTIRSVLACQSMTRASAPRYRRASYTTSARTARHAVRVKRYIEDAQIVGIVGELKSAEVFVVGQSDVRWPSYVAKTYFSMHGNSSETIEWTISAFGS
ncbi:hypothetical protein EVAR_39628_1 [Eumeta japonica]|uniref:Uncharacterized protein n=1 Tax=Eumeta variegata TaxID=151549 RepID=A0A4C1WFX3_EUMVA|nr:hypothetical protein EVAR_39628_1 [Eumeta japonica]